LGDIGGYSIDEKLLEPFQSADLKDKEIKVGQNQLFVLSDLRSVENDSRTFGAIERSSVVGRAAYKVWQVFGAIKKTTLSVAPNQN
jgi:hypothetical protein